MVSNVNDILIVIPARYNSSRFPGKPLAPILGKPMLQRVWETSQRAIEGHSADAIVATEDERIYDFCQTHNIAVTMTSEACNTGTERALETVKTLDHPAQFIVNLQGDNVLCPDWFVSRLIEAYQANPIPQVITPYVKLNWEELDTLRTNKEKTPFSGTTVVFDQSERAKWFSKQIIPAIRKEDKLRQQEPFSPVCRHIGLYGYHREVLLQLPNLAPCRYENYEGLEQLAFLENDIPIQMVEVDYRGREGMSGVDSPEDVARAEAILQQEGEY